METLELDQIVPTIEKIKFTIIQMEQRLTKMSEEVEEKEKQLEQREKDLEEELEKSRKLAAEYQAVQKELSKISSLYSEMEGKQEDVSSVKNILGIYITLLEKVFEGKPHAKILYMLHGGSNSMTREALTKSSAFSPVVVLRSIHELRNAELVDYDDEKNLVTLKQRIYD